MPWLQLKINTQAAQAEAIGDLLTENGAQAVTFVDAKDTPIYEPQPGETKLWPDIQVIGLYDVLHDMQGIISQLHTLTFTKHASFSLDPLEDKDWVREWMTHFHPMQFGKRLWICPSWRPVVDTDAVNVILDPGLAFGTGTHPTTSLCLQWLDSLELRDKTLIDLGCGSGILAIAALKLGAKRVIGIDIDPQALQASQENAKRNGVEDKLTLYLAKDQPQQKADIVVANILTGPLRTLHPSIVSMCKKDALLALSGLLREQAEELMAVYEKDFVMDIPVFQDDWARLTGVKR
jgi:ribosomal protein L11 methyltransferase